MNDNNGQPKYLGIHPEYTGILREPVLFPPEHGGEAEHQDIYEQSSRSHKYIAENFEMKIDALLDLYDLDPEEEISWWALAYFLALRHVPGFRIEYTPELRKSLAGKRRGPGRPAKTSIPEYYVALPWLTEQFARIKARNPLLSDTRVCKSIRKQKDLPEFFLSGGKPLSAKRLLEYVREADRQASET